MSNLKIGHRSNSLTVISKPFLIEKGGRKRSAIKVKCDCGNIKVYFQHLIKSNRRLSCGCMKNNPPIIRKHNKSHTRIYSIYRKIKDRCYNKNSDSFKYYGGRGISMCKEWLDNFRSFDKWAMENGYKKHLTIDRIDVNGNYEPKNCRWVSIKVQNRNKRSNIYLEHDGIKLTLKEWSEKTGIGYCNIIYRYKKGWTPQRILGDVNKPIRDGRKIVLTNTGEIFPSIKEASIKLNESYHNIYNCLNRESGLRGLNFKYL